MKKIFFLVVFLCLIQFSFAQTNTFPSSGNVGIGSTSPGNKLDINVGSVAGGKLQVYGSSSPTIQIQATNNPLVSQWLNDDVASYFGTVSNYSLLFKTNDISRMTINNSGYVGIGTTSPGNKLDINVGSVAGGKLQVYGSSSPTIQIQATNNPLVSQWLNDDAGSYLGTVSNYPFYIKTNDINRLIISNTGDIGIGTISPSEKLSVNGNISAKKLIVTQSGWSDYVFAKNYKLRSLESLQTYINKYKHLPEVPSENEIETKGICVGDNQALLLKTIEELTLYLLKQDEKIKALEQKVSILSNNKK